MAYWLLKSEPTVYSFDELAREPKRTTCWEGVRNYQARNLLRDRIAKGDLAFFYHSSCEFPGIVGIVEVVREGYPDPFAFEPRHRYYDPKSDPEKPRWYAIDVRYKRRLGRLITLAELKQQRQLEGLTLLRPGNRLSVMPVSAAHWRRILALE